MPRDVTDDAGRAGDDQGAVGIEGGAREAGAGGPVHPRVTVRAQLTRILQRHARVPRGEPHCLYLVSGLLSAHCARGGVTLGRHVAQSPPASHAELPIALEIAAALVDVVDEIP